MKTARRYPNVCACGARLVYIDTDKWGRTAFDAEPRKVILSPIGKHWVCVPPHGRITRAIIETGFLNGDTLAYIPHFYAHKKQGKAMERRKNASNKNARTIERRLQQTKAPAALYAVEQYQVPLQ